MKLTVTEEDEHTLCVSQFHSGTNSTEEVVRWLKGKKAKSAVVYPKEDPGCERTFVRNGGFYIALEFSALSDVKNGVLQPNYPEHVPLEKHIEKTAD